MGGAIAYPDIDIDAALAMVVLAALTAESLCAFIFRRVANGG
ncbi:hypothetical protein [Methylocystis rosea]|nr:hypothetical protein [Methylocystis rosea]